MNTDNVSDEDIQHVMRVFHCRRETAKAILRLTEKEQPGANKA